MEVLFLRHGATAGNLEKRYIGRTDEPLCPLGQEQARALAKQGLAVEHLYVSPALRTVQTAQIVFPDTPYTTVPALWETDFGIFEGKTAWELESEPRYRAWVEAECKTPVPGGESVENFKARCCHAFQKIMAELPQEGSVGFVIHGGCIMAILEAFALPKQDFYAYHIKNGAFLRCVYRDGSLFLE